MSSGLELPQFPENDPRWLTNVPNNIRVTRDDFIEFKDQLSDPSIVTILPFRPATSKQYDAFFTPEIPLEDGPGQPRKIVEVKSFDGQQAYTVHGHVLTHAELENHPFQQEPGVSPGGRAAILRATVTAKQLASRWTQREIGADVTVYPYITSTVYDPHFTNGPWFASRIPPMGGDSQLFFWSAYNDSLAKFTRTRQALPLFANDPEADRPSHIFYPEQGKTHILPLRFGRIGVNAHGEVTPIEGAKETEAMTVSLQYCLGRRAVRGFCDPANRSRVRAHYYPDL